MPDAPTPLDLDGVGWYEVIHPTATTTLLAYVHEDGSVYFPETNDGQVEFALAAARGHVHRLIRADAVLDLLPGRSEAEVKAEALREAGRWLVRIGYVGDFTFDAVAPDALWEAFVDAAHEDVDGTMHGNTLTRAEVDDWLSGEAGRPVRARADRLAAEGGVS